MKKSFLTFFEVMNVENSFQAHFRMWSADEEFKGDLQTRHKYLQISGAVGGQRLCPSRDSSLQGGWRAVYGAVGAVYRDGNRCHPTLPCNGVSLGAELGGGAVETWLQGLALVPSHHCRSPQTLSKPHRSAPTLKFCVTDCKITMHLSNCTEAASWNIQF